MNGIPFQESDLATFAGLTVVVPMVVGALKFLFKSWLDGKEPVACLVMTYVLGIAAKLTIKGAFPGAGWLALVVGLLFVAVAAGAVYDKVGKPLIGNVFFPKKKED